MREKHIKEGGWYAEMVLMPATVIQLPIRGSHFTGTLDTETLFHGNFGFQSNEEKHGL